MSNHQRQESAQAAWRMRSKSPTFMSGDYSNSTFKSISLEKDHEIKRLTSDIQRLKGEYAKEAALKDQEVEHLKLERDDIKERLDNEREMSNKMMSAIGKNDNEEEMKKLQEKNSALEGELRDLQIRYDSEQCNLQQQFRAQADELKALRAEPKQSNPEVEGMLRTELETKDSEIESLQLQLNKLDETLREELDSQRLEHIKALSQKAEEMELREDNMIERLTSEHLLEIERYKNLHHNFMAEVKSMIHEDSIQQLESKFNRLQDDLFQNSMKRHKKGRMSRVLDQPEEDTELANKAVQVSVGTSDDMDMRTQMFSLKQKYDDSQHLHSETLQTVIQKGENIKIKYEKLFADYQKLTKKYTQYKKAYTKTRTAEKKYKEELENLQESYNILACQRDSVLTKQLDESSEATQQHIPMQIYQTTEEEGPMGRYGDEENHMDHHYDAPDMSEDFNPMDLDSNANHLQEKSMLGGLSEIHSRAQLHEVEAMEESEESDENEECLYEYPMTSGEKKVRESRVTLNQETVQLNLEDDDESADLQDKIFETQRNIDHMHQIHEREIQEMKDSLQEVQHDLHESESRHHLSEVSSNISRSPRFKGLTHLTSS